MHTTNKLRLPVRLATLRAALGLLCLFSCSGDDTVNPELVFCINEIDAIHIQGFDDNGKLVGFDLDDSKRQRWLIKLKDYSNKGKGGNTFFGNMYLTLKNGEIKEISLYSKGAEGNVWNADQYHGSLTMEGVTYVLEEKNR